ncbi:hypothetical protein [Salinibacter sp. 10B]|uniref:hypothetical protein n=1 Tax=Salinibacter sp. 10B TaxID=1923971 RepID=UPI0011B0AF73|nr:hypothetical protein [Salinibacter sp. 10B]
MFFDLETTGLRPDRGARITEMAVVDQECIRFDWAADAEPPSDADALLDPGRRRQVDDSIGRGRAATAMERRMRAPPAGGFGFLSFLQAQDYFRDSLRLQRPSVLCFGAGLYWPDLDEYVSVRSILHGRQSAEHQS